MYDLSFIISFCFWNILSGVLTKQIWELELNGTHKVLAYAITLIGDEINIMKRNAEVLLKVCNEIGLKMKMKMKNTKYMENTKYMDNFYQSIFYC